MTWEQIERAVRDRLVHDGAHDLLVASFLDGARHVYDGVSGLVAGHDIEPVGDLADFDALGEADRQTGLDTLPHVAMIKLNGGLGTSMGLERAKSLLPVKDGLTFLDIIARQVLHLRSAYGVPLPLLLMTSFNTDRDTLDKLATYPALADEQPGIPLTFLQNRVPKLMADTLLPAESPDAPDKAWCPPGHGDIYTALIASGLLDRLLASGITYAFISNADNLGAVIDPAIPGHMANRSIPFLVEVTDRTEADKKGGHLARSAADGRLLLRESAQCPPEEQEEFQDISRYRYFNTNNLWINLPALRSLVDQTSAPPRLALMINRKHLDPRDELTPKVLQLETAMGAALSSFEGAEALRVPRTRFAPVKTTDDLLALWSDAYELTPAMHVRAAAGRKIPAPPVIKLDPRYYRKIDDFTARFPHGAPSLIDCRSLEVIGDHRFESGVRITGDCRFFSAGEGPVTVSGPCDGGKVQPA